MAKREYTGYNRANKDQLLLSKLPIPPKPENDGQLARKMMGLSEVIHQRNLNNAIHLAIEASQGHGILIDYFAEIGRRFGTHTAPVENTAAMLPFSFEGQAVRVVGQNEEPWWVLADVCEALDIRNNRDASARLEAYEKDVAITDTLGGLQKITVINESGLWSLVLTSRKPEAKRFKKWLTAEVIPTIRKTGSYTLTHKELPSDKTETQPVVENKKPKRRPDVLFRQLKQIALDAGKDEKDALRIAGNGVMKETGIDVIGLMSIN